MKQTIRTFIGIKIQPEQKLIDQITEFKQLFQNELIKWVPAENFHLTLRFLGETSQDQLVVLNEKLEMIASLSKPFSFQLTGAGYFERKGTPRVLFVNLISSEEMSHLAAMVEESVVAAGFQNELKPFRPHLTLGRIKHLGNRTQFISVMDNLPSVEYQQVSVSEFILYQSILNPDGPVYQPLKTYSIQ